MSEDVRESIADKFCIGLSGFSNGAWEIILVGRVREELRLKADSVPFSVGKILFSADYASMAYAVSVIELHGRIVREYVEDDTAFVTADGREMLLVHGIAVVVSLSDP